MIPGASGGGDRVPDYEARSLARNATLNIAALFLPAPAALVALPILARLYAPETLGLVTLAWAVFAYFNLLDLGLGRALTQMVASTYGAGRRDGVAGLVRGTSILLALIGVLAGVLMFAGADWIAQSALRVPGPQVPATRTAVRVLALGLPFVTLTSGLRGLLEAHLRFDLVNAVRIPSIALMYLGPVLALPFSRSVVAAMAVLVAVRMATCVAYAVCVLRVEPGVAGTAAVSPSAWGRLFGIGGWLTLANVASTTLGVLDRLVIAAVVPVASLAYYTAPQELANKLATLPAAISSVLFPAVSAETARGRARAASLFARSLRYTFVLLFPVTFTLASLAPEVLRVWLGPAFSVRGALLLQCFCFGILVNGLAFVPLAVLQGGGGASAAAWLQIVELPLFVAALWAGATRFGLPGAAIVWGSRMVVDTCCLLILATRQVSAGWSTSRWTAAFVSLSGVAFVLPVVMASPAARLGVLAGVLGAAALVAVRTADDTDRQLLAAAWSRVSRGRPS